MGSFVRKNRLFKVLHSFLILDLILRLLFLGLFVWLKSSILVVYSGLSLFVLITAFFINRNSDQRTAFFIILIESIIFTTLTTLFYGWMGGFFLFFFELLLLIFINSELTQSAKLIFGIFLSLYLVTLYMVCNVQGPLQPIESYVREAIFAINLIQGLFSFSMLGYFFELATETAENEIIQANQRLLNMANTDPVTSLINRRVMMNHIEDEKLKVDRGSKPFVIVMLDIDNFKQINDEYGHDGGDFVLVQLAQRISYALRKTDLVSRWGGDEFLLMLPETRLDDGKAVAEKVHDRIITTPFVYREQDIPVTITLGVSQCDANVGVGSCIRKADQALYFGKQAGKNQVITESMLQD